MSGRRVEPAIVTAYSLYGLLVESELELPGVPPSGAAAPDVRLALGDLADRMPAGSGENWFTAGADGVSWFHWRGFATVRLTRGAEVVVDAAEGVDPQALRAAVTGPVFSVLLVQRGLLPLHASSVAIDDRAVAFSADSGGGKSTLAAALCERGFEFLADDVTAIEVDDGRGWMLPGFPQQSLTPESLAHLGRGADGLPFVNPLEEKRVLRRPGAFRQERVELDRVYAVADGARESFQELSRREALFVALRLCHRPALLERAIGQAALLERCARVVERVPFYRLSRPRSLERLPALAAEIERHVRS